MKFALAITLCLMAATLCAATCPVSTCNKSDPALPTIWLNTTSMNTAIRGSSIVFYPRQPNGDIYELMSTSLSIDVLGEITHDSNGTCETQGMYVLSQYTKANRVPRYLAFKDACCTHDHIVDVIEGDISRERVVINVTYPAWPEFWFEFTVSTVNETLTIPRPPTPEIGEGYNIEFLAQKIKLDVNVHNWPWITDEQPEARYNDTFLQFFMTTFSQLDEVGRIRVFDSDDAKTLHYSAVSTNAAIQMDFLKVYTADGTDHYSLTNRLPPNLALDIQGSTMYFPAILSICQGDYAITPRYQHLSYDPNLNAVFLGDTPIPTPANPNRKNKLHPAAYAVPIALVAIAIAAGAIYAFVIRPKLLSSQILRRSTAETPI
jgi:hypothetical protein